MVKQPLFIIRIQNKDMHLEQQEDQDGLLI